MKIEKYEKLCESYDQILLHSSSSKIVANSYLHILKAHPETLNKYCLSQFSIIYLQLRFGLIALIRVFQSIFTKKHTFRKIPASDILFVSHLTNNQQLSKDDDAYFGSLPNQLSKMQINSNIALIKHIKISNHQLLKNLESTKINRVLLNSSLSFLSEIKLYIGQITSKKELNSIIKDLKIDNILAKFAVVHRLSSGTFNSLRIAIQIEQIIKKTNPKYIITTFEGHAWERLVYYYARRTNPNIKCFGYQHSAVFEHHNSIKRPLNNKYNPDVVFTSGKIAENILNQSQVKIGKVLCLGTDKYLPPIISPCKSNCCLVIPEGSISESLILFNLSFNYAMQDQNQQFIWRLHPLLSFQKLKKYSPIFKKIPSNIYLSEDDLDSDIKKCNSVLYRGSTAVINAINAGLKPIYYQQSTDELGVDPIYLCKKGKFIVKNQNELKVAFSKDIDNVSRLSLQNFAQKFYSPINIDALLKEMDIRPI